MCCPVCACADNAVSCPGRWHAGKRTYTGIVVLTRRKTQSVLLYERMTSPPPHG